MRHMLCYKLIPVAGSIVGHSFHDSPNRLLVIFWNSAELIDEAVLNLAQRSLSQGGSYAGEDVRDVKTELERDFAQVRRRRITRTGFVVCLRSLCNSDRLSNLVLRLTASLPLVLQAGSYLFGKMQNYSSNRFTNAQKCIIVHSTPHEIARICTMPNTSINEQARKQARETLEKRGQSAKDFADQHNLNPSTVYAVLSGQSHCRRGEAHRAAVLLGIKDGVIEQ